MIQILKVFLNPTVIVGMLAVFTLTSTWHRVTGWVQSNEIVRSWKKAVAERDRAAQTKDTIIAEVVAKKEEADAENERMRQEFEAAESRRREIKAADYVWSADDIGVLNGVTATKRR